MWCRVWCAGGEDCALTRRWHGAAHGRLIELLRWSVREPPRSAGGDRVKNLRGGHLRWVHNMRTASETTSGCGHRAHASLCLLDTYAWPCVVFGPERANRTAERQAEQKYAAHDPEHAGEPRGPPRANWEAIVRIGSFAAHLAGVAKGNIVQRMATAGSPEPALLRHAEHVLHLQYAARWEEESVLFPCTAAARGGRGAAQR